MIASGIGQRRAASATNPASFFETHPRRGGDGADDGATVGAVEAKSDSCCMALACLLGRRFG
jgi:hypothetical protein